MASRVMNYPSDRQAVVLYDGECPLCQRSVAILKRLDWLGQLRYANARDRAAWPETNIVLDRDRMLEEMHLVTPNRQSVYAGFDAFRWMAGRVPLLWGIWPMLFLPGVPWLGHRIYRWIAKNRFHLVPCHEGECAVPWATGNAERLSANQQA